jgi:urease accessory protein
MPDPSSALLLLADGRFPAGGHAHSAGTEAAVRFGDVRDEATLARFLAGRLATTGTTEAAVAAAAAAARDAATIAELDAELTARVPSPRLRAVSRRAGRQLLRAGARVWPAPELAWLGAEPHQPIALGVLVGVVGGTPRDAARISLHHQASAVTGAAVRLLGLDPVAVAAVHARAGIDEVLARVDEWVAAPPCDLPADGSALGEILGEDHGAWAARLFVG